MAVPVINAEATCVTLNCHSGRGLQELRLPMFRVLSVSHCMTQDLGGRAKAATPVFPVKCCVSFVEVEVLRSRVLRPTK